MPKIEGGLSEDDVVLAGELALGVLEGEELALAQRRRIADPAFAREVERWRDHFAAAALRGPAEAPSAGIEARVIAAIEAESGGQVTPLPPRATSRWRNAALAFAAVAAVLAVLVLRPQPPVPAQPVLVAVLDVSATHASVVARVEPGKLRLSGALAVPASRDAQAWVIDGTAPPRSLGVLHRAGDQVLEVVPARALQPGQTLAVSIEPLGGAPGPLPTGPVVAAGKIQSI